LKEISTQFVAATKLAFDQVLYVESDQVIFTAWYLLDNWRTSVFADSSHSFRYPALRLVWQFCSLINMFCIFFPIKLDYKMSSAFILILTQCRKIPVA
jgi:hypothetical protein